MRLAKSFIYGVPLLIGLLTIASFVNTTLISRDKKNEMTIGSIGEPSTLNPIGIADKSASDVNDLIFNGLLKYNENLEIIGDLAKTWALSQKTTLFFDDSAKAEAAAQQIQALQAAGKTGSHFQGVSVNGKEAILLFSLPGYDESQKIYDALSAPASLSLHGIRIELKSSSARESYAAFSKSFPDAARLVRVWFESENAYEITVAGDEKPVLEALKAHYSKSPSLEAKIAPLDTLPFLAEPEVVFQLRDDVRWHDGADFTAADVEFTYRMVMDDAVASPRKSDYELVQSVETPDAHTVHVVYRKPYSPALLSWMISILPAHLLDGKPPAWWAKHFNRAPIGTGPFKFAEWKTNEYIRLERNPHYFRKGPWLDSVIFRAIPDPLTLRLAFEMRQVDFWGVDPWAVGTFEKDPRYDLFTSAGNMYTYIGWNLRKPLFQDLRVRQAFAHAVNIEEMIRYILYGHGQQSTGIFTPKMWFFDPKVRPYTYDPEKAKQLLDEAGWKPGKDGIREKDGARLQFTLITNNANEIRRDIATLVQDDFRKIGVSVKIELYEWAVFLKRFINGREFDACVLGWSLGYDYDQYQIWHSSQTNPEQLNMVSYKNAEVDRLLNQIRQEYDRDKILQMASRMQQLVYEDQPYLFLYVPEGTNVMWKDSYRVFRPSENGFTDSPVQITKAGWSYYLEYFYRPEYKNRLPQAN